MLFLLRKIYHLVMYSILLFERFVNSGKPFYLVTKLTGVRKLYRLGYYNIRMFNKGLIRFSKFFIIIRYGSPSHYLVATQPMKCSIYFDTFSDSEGIPKWFVLPYNRVGSLMERILSFAVNDTDRLPDMDAVISFLHDKGGAIRHLLHERNKLPL